MEADEDKLRTSPCPTEYGLGKTLRRPLMGTKNFLIWTAVATIPQFVYRQRKSSLMEGQETEYMAYNSGIRVVVFDIVRKT